MDKVAFLERLATTVHYDEAIKALLEEQPMSIQAAYASGSSDQLKSQFSNVGYLANEVKVIEW